MISTRPALTGLMLPAVSFASTRQTYGAFPSALSRGNVYFRVASTRYRLTDAQGSTRLLTNAAGAVTSSYVYDAFGTLQSQGTPETKYLYTGQQFDQNTGLYSLRARMYNPTAGRFLSMDTWAYNLQNPIELNRYVYTANNPVNMWDPSGNTVLQDLGRIYNHIVNNVNQSFANAIFGGISGGLGYMAGTMLFGLTMGILETSVEKWCQTKTPSGSIGIAMCEAVRRDGTAMNIDQNAWKAFIYAFDPVEFVLNMLFGAALGTIGGGIVEQASSLTSSVFRLASGIGATAWIAQALTWLLLTRDWGTSITTPLQIAGFVGTVMTAGVGKWLTAASTTGIIAPIALGTLAVTFVTALTRGGSAWFDPESRYYLKSSAIASLNTTFSIDLQEMLEGLYHRGSYYNPK